MFSFLPVGVAIFSITPSVTIRGPVAHINSRAFRHNDTLYIPAASIARAYGLILSYKDGNSIVLSSRDLCLEFELNSSNVIINGEVVEMDGPADWIDGRLTVPFYLALLTLPSRFTSGESPAHLSLSNRLLVIIDPGHGGIDPGAIGEGGLMEKEVVLEISRKVKDLLEIQGYDVFMTRNKDCFISLKRRARVANHRQADLFVSIHANAALNNLAQGTETFYYAPASDPLARALASLENAVLRLEPHSEFNNELIFYQSEEKNGRLMDSIQAARAVQRAISRVTRGPDRGIKAAEFYVLKRTMMPSILVETGFLSNQGEGKLLADTDYRARMAQAIARGIDNYLNFRARQKNPPESK